MKCFDYKIFKRIVSRGGGGGHCRNQRIILLCLCRTLRNWLYRSSVVVYSYPWKFVRNNSIRDKILFAPPPPNKYYFHSTSMVHLSSEILSKISLLLYRFFFFSFHLLQINNSTIERFIPLRSVLYLSYKLFL